MEISLRADFVGLRVWATSLVYFWCVFRDRISTHAPCRIFCPAQSMSDSFVGGISCDRRLCPYSVKMARGGGGSGRFGYCGWEIRRCYRRTTIEIICEQGFVGPIYPQKIQKFATLPEFETMQKLDVASKRRMTTSCNPLEPIDLFWYHQFCAASPFFANIDTVVPQSIWLRVPRQLTDEL